MATKIGRVRLSMDTTTALGNEDNGVPRWTLRLLGGFQLGELPGGKHLALPGKRERILLAYLALSPKGSQSRRKLATLLWGDNDDETALDNLRTTVWRLRKALGDKQHRVVASDGEDIVLDCGAFAVDALTFLRLAAQPETTELERAAKLYTGELLHGLDVDNDEFESWRRTEAARYREQGIDVLNRLMTRWDELGETERAIETGLRILQLEPLHEAAARRLMRLYGKSGRRGAAIQLYRALAETLRTELGAQPEAETRAAHAEIARGGEETLTPQSPPGAPDRPAHAVSPPVLAAPSVQAGPGRGIKLRWPSGLILAGGLAAALSLAVLTQFGVVREQGQQNEIAKDSATSAARPVSVAVLPFTNLSGDPSQEYLSDGITEEITSALSKVADMRVVARTSAYQFKGENRDVRSIGRQLNASHFVEGSVRSDGGRLRITAQLVEASGGTHLWSETYDRQISDIFAIEEDIARTIAASLRMPLGLDQTRNLISNRLDPESYRQFLRARQLVRARTRGGAQAIEILEPLVARYGDFAPAWVQLSAAYGIMVVAKANVPAEELRRIRTEYGLKRLSAAKRAVELDPNSAGGYWALSTAQTGPGSLLTRENYLSKALALDANNADALNAYGQLLLRVGRVNEAPPIFQRLVTLEPFVPVFIGNLAEALWLNGQNEAVLNLAETAPYGNSRGAELAMVYASMGRFTDAADVVLESSTSVYPPELLKEASLLLRSAPAKTAMPQRLPRLASLGFIYLYIGAPERALEYFEETGASSLLWHSSYAPLRKTARFKALVRKTGLVDYWRAKGWPEFCHPTTGGDFACE